jgi:hypothetical protein
MATSPFIRLLGFAPGSFAPQEVIASVSFDDPVDSVNPNAVYQPFTTVKVPVFNASGSNTVDIQLPAGEYRFLGATMTYFGAGGGAGDLAAFGLGVVGTATMVLKIGEFDLTTAATADIESLPAFDTATLSDLSFRCAGPVFDAATNTWIRNVGDEALICDFTEATDAGCSLLIELAYRPVA